MSAKKQKLVVIDSNALIHRAFHALPPTLTDGQGRPTNAVYGFTTIFLKALKDLKPDYLAACFDRKEYAIAYASSRKLPTVVKANGLTKSRGISIVNTYEGATGAINACFAGRFAINNSNINNNLNTNTVLIEDYLHGHEASISVICDGTDYAVLPTCKIYKKLLDQEQGNYTEGMGAISPHPLILN